MKRDLIRDGLGDAEPKVVGLHFRTARAEIRVGGGRHQRQHTARRIARDEIRIKVVAAVTDVHHAGQRLAIMVALASYHERDARSLPSSRPRKSHQ